MSDFSVLMLIDFAVKLFPRYELGTTRLELREMLKGLSWIFA